MIFITGASSGIGAACARIFAQKGKNLLLIARRVEKLKVLAKELQNEYQIKINYFQLDVTQRKEVQDFIQINHPLLEQVEVLINNAGKAKGMSTFQEGNLEDWKEMIDTNLVGLLSITREVIPFFIKKNSGHIVNLGSVAGHYIYPKGNIYCATKFAVHALNDAIRQDLNGTAIRVTEISPGMVETEFSEIRFQDTTKAKAVYQGMKPLTATDIAESIEWCVSRPQHVNIQEIVLYPTAQASPTLVSRT